MGTVADRPLAEAIRRVLDHLSHSKVVSYHDAFLRVAIVTERSRRQHAQLFEKVQAEIALQWRA